MHNRQLSQTENNPSVSPGFVQCRSVKPAHYFNVKQQKQSFEELMQKKKNINSSLPTFPLVAAGGTNVDVSFRHTARDAHVAHTLQLHVKVGVADFITVRLPLIIWIIAQIITPDEALPYHPTLLLCTSLDLHVPMPTGL